MKTGRIPEISVETALTNFRESLNAVSSQFQLKNNYFAEM